MIFFVPVIIILMCTESIPIMGIVSIVTGNVSVFSFRINSMQLRVNIKEPVPAKVKKVVCKALEDFHVTSWKIW